MCIYLMRIWYGYLSVWQRSDGFVFLFVVRERDKWLVRLSFDHEARRYILIRFKDKTPSNNGGMARHIAKPIPGFEGYYACNFGHIYSKKVSGKLEKKKLFTPKDGYLTVGLTATGETVQKRYKAHRMIAMTWLENPDDLPIVNHKDGDKSNIRVSNLEYVSNQRNVQHAYETGLTKPRTRPVCQINDNGELVAEYKSITAAGKATGIYIRTIQQVCARKDKGQVVIIGFTRKIILHLK